MLIICSLSAWNIISTWFILAPNMLLMSTTILNQMDTFHWVSNLNHLSIACSHYLFFCSQPHPNSFKPSPDLHQAWWKPAHILVETSSQYAPNLLYIFIERVPTCSKLQTHFSKKYLFSWELVVGAAIIIFKLNYSNRPAHQDPVRFWFFLCVRGRDRGEQNIS